MTKEELEKEAEEWLNKWELCNKCENKVDCISIFSYCKKVVLQSYLAGAEPREKRIAELEDKLANADYQLEGRDLKIKELEARCNELFLQTCEQAELIEKMKCCSNCENEGDYTEPYRYGTGWCNICKRHKIAKGNFDKWEIKEK
jgi:hypothetical protein